MIVRRLYNVLGLALLPAIVVAGLVHRVRRRKGLDRPLERLGHLPASLLARCRGREVIWIHAASVGETAAAATVIPELRRLRPGAAIVLSQWTETGRAVAERSGADGAFYVPFDLPWVVRGVLRQIRPNLLVTVDTEIWPNLTWLASEAGVRLALINGRISDRSLRRIRALGLHWFYRPVVAGIERHLMQSRLDAARITELGARAGTVQVVGNVKFDERFPTVDAARLAWWRETLGLEPTAPVLLAGSTGAGEDEMVVDAWRALLVRHPELRLILVPRAIPQAPTVAAMVRGRGHETILRSELPAQAERSRERRAVIVVDTLGELSELYAAASVAFVGRSLVPLGGSNVLQPAAQGKPVVVGPYTHNFRESVGLLRAAGVLVEVSGPDALADAVASLLGRGDLAALDVAARAAVAANRGAAARTAVALCELLDA